MSRAGAALRALIWPRRCLLCHALLPDGADPNPRLCAFCAARLPEPFSGGISLGRHRLQRVPGSRSRILRQTTHFLGQTRSSSRAATVRLTALPFAAAISDR